MDRTANPLFKAGLAAITATTLVVAPTVAPPMRQAISLPDIRSASVRLSAFTLTPRAANAPVSPLTALKLPLSPAVPEAANARTSPPRPASITQLAPSVQPRAAAVQSPAPVGVPARSGASAAATAGPAVANSITNGIDQAYQFVQYWVDYGVNLAQWGAGFVPVIGGLVSAQIGIVYDNLVRPIANSFVYNLVDPIINDPSFSNIVNSFGRFGGDIVNSVINFAWAEVRYLLPPLPPLPGLALQSTPNADGTLPAAVHEALAPFTKAFKDAEAHFSEALGLTKTDPKPTTLEKAGTAAQTTTESSKDTTKETPKEDGKATDASATAGVKDTTEAKDSKVSAEGKAPTGDKDKKTGDTAKTDGTKTDGKETTVEGTKESPKESPKDATTPAVTTDADGTSGDGTTGTKPAKDTVTLKDSAKDPKSSADAAPTDKPDKTVKPKIPTVSTTEHGAISAQGIVRGPVSQSTSGQSGPSTSASKTSDSKVSDSRTSDSKASDSVKPDSATPDTKTTDTKATNPKTTDAKTKPESKTSGTKSPTSASTHDSSKSPGSASSSSKSGGEGSTSHGGGHD